MRSAESSASAPRAAKRDEHTSLDWPFHTGLVARVIDRLEEKVAKQRRRRRYIVTTSTATAAILLVGFWLVPLQRDTATVVTAAAEHRSVTLADGSRAELNAETSIHTDFRFGRRHLRLEQGEAFFSVVSSPANPFVVETPRGTVRVTGTVFDVRLHRDDTPEVTLLEGKVTFEMRGAAPVHLAPGQQLSLEGALPRVRELSSVDMENLTAWREGRLVLDGLTLAEAADRLARYHGATIAVAPDIAHLRPGGTVPLANLRSVLEALQDVLPIRVEPQADGTHRIVAR